MERVQSREAERRSDEGETTFRMGNVNEGREERVAMRKRMGISGKRKENMGSRGREKGKGWSRAGWFVLDDVLKRIQAEKSKEESEREMNERKIPNIFVGTREAHERVKDGNASPEDVLESRRRAMRTDITRRKVQKSGRLKADDTTASKNTSTIKDSHEREGSDFSRRGISRRSRGPGRHEKRTDRPLGSGGRGRRHPREASGWPAGLSLLRPLRSAPGMDMTVSRMTFDGIDAATTTGCSFERGTGTSPPTMKVAVVFRRVAVTGHVGIHGRLHPDVSARHDSGSLHEGDRGSRRYFDCDMTARVRDITVVVSIHAEEGRTGHLEGDESGGGWDPEPREEEEDAERKEEPEAEEELKGVESREGSTNGVKDRGGGITSRTGHVGVDQATIEEGGVGEKGAVGTMKGGVEEIGRDGTEEAIGRRKAGGERREEEERSQREKVEAQAESDGYHSEKQICCEKTAEDASDSNQKLAIGAEESSEGLKARGADEKRGDKRKEDKNENKEDDMEWRGRREGEEGIVNRTVSNVERRGRRVESKYSPIVATSIHTPEKWVVRWVTGRRKNGPVSSPRGIPDMRATSRRFEGRVNVMEERRDTYAALGHRFPHHSTDSRGFPGMRSLNVRFPENERNGNPVTHWAVRERFSPFGLNHETLFDRKRYKRADTYKVSNVKLPRNSASPITEEMENLSLIRMKNSKFHVPDRRIMERKSLINLLLRLDERRQQNGMGKVLEQRDFADKSTIIGHDLTKRSAIFSKEDLQNLNKNTTKSLLDIVDNMIETNSVLIIKKITENNWESAQGENRRELDKLGGKSLSALNKVIATNVSKFGLNEDGRNRRERRSGRRFRNGRLARSRLLMKSDSIMIGRPLIRYSGCSNDFGWLKEAWESELQFEENSQTRVPEPLRLKQEMESLFFSGVKRMVVMFSEKTVRRILAEDLAAKMGYIASYG